MSFLKWIIRITVSRSQQLLEVTWLDAVLGCMAKPEVIEKSCQHAWLLHPRFGLAQTRPDENITIRAVNISFHDQSNGVLAGNMIGHTIPTEKLGHEMLDDLVISIKRLFELTGEAPWLFKADLGNSFKKIPICASRNWLCGIAFMIGSMVHARIRT